MLCAVVFNLEIYLSHHSSVKMATVQDPPGLSEYETTRAKNIERNNARLRALGLISEREETQSNAIAWKITLPEVGNRSDQEEENSDNDGDDDYSGSEEDGDHSSPKTKKRKKHRPPSTAKSSPSRKSRRLQGLTAEGLVMAAPLSKEELYEERKSRVQECREARQAAAVKFYENNQDTKQAAKENPTATYEHCLMRVQTMTEKALANRVKAIERAAGKHCAVKMAIFKSCLQDEGQWELAELASEALERLKALKPPPENK